MIYKTNYAALSRSTIIRLGMTLFMLLFVVHSNAQTWDEWFRQRRTQRRYLVKQIGLLKTYLHYLREGYEIAGKGLSTIHAITHNEFGLHDDFFNSLGTINPAIRASVRRSEMEHLLRDIPLRATALENFSNGHEMLTTEEAAYVSTVCQAMRQSCEVLATEWTMLITHGELKMKDNERLSQIDDRYQTLLDMHVFMESFRNDVLLLAHQREEEKSALSSLAKQFND